MVMGVGVIVMGLGVIMISVDVAWWLRDKRDSQNDADAIALAAAQELPDRDAAEATGLEWADFNGVNPSTEMATPDCADGELGGAIYGDKFCFIEEDVDGGTLSKVRVKISRPSNSFIADALGVGSPTLNPSAAAQVVYVRGACVMPWGIVGENSDRADIYGLDVDKLYVFQNVGDFIEDASGNFGAISIYGEGADTYTDAIEGNCEPKNNSCTGEPMVFVDETLFNCTSETGVKGSVTWKALNNRAPNSLSPGACDAFTHAEALDRVDSDTTPYCPERLVPIAVISSFPPQGSSLDIDIYGIVNFYLAGWSKNKTCITFPDDSERCGFVWGYLIPDAPVTSANVVFTTQFIPFAPTGVALVE
jgi:hypothetical protein